MGTSPSGVFTLTWPPDRGVENGNVGVDVQVVPGSAIEGMGFDFDVDHEVARSTLAPARVSRRGKPQARPMFDAGRDIDVHPFGFVNSRLARAGRDTLPGHAGPSHRNRDTEREKPDVPS